MKLDNIVKFTDTIAPFHTAEEWDNVGLLAGSPDDEITRVLLALDVTPDVVREAHEKGIELIVSHHPVIFAPLRALRPDSAEYLLAKYGVSALCLHTNLDRADNGVNTALAAALGLKNTVFYPEDFILVGEPERIYNAGEYAGVVKERLHAPSVRYTNGTVSRVAVSSGGGGDGVELSQKYGFDAFVTGELKHHQYLSARQQGVAAFDAGHFSTEDVVIAPLREQLSQRFPEVKFLISETCACPYQAI